MSVLRALPPYGAQVMVIDDDLDLLDALCEVLRDAGYRVSSAGNGFDALRLLADAESLPDLILLDLMMPIMDGHTFRELQLADPRLCSLPTVALSAGPIDGRIHALRLAAWMSKPVSVAALVGAVERHRLRRATEASVSAAHSGHSMQFYDSDQQLASDVAGFVAPAVRTGDRTIVLATGEHREMFEAELARIGCDPAVARARGTLAFFDARAMLDSLLVGGRLTESRFTEVVSPMMLDAERSSRRVRVYGEMVDLLWREGEVATAVSLEQCWNRLLATSRCDLHCAYSAPASELHRASAGWIRQQHASDSPVVA